MFPFEIKNRMISWEEIVSFEDTTVNPLRSYGGYGIRLGKKSKAYIVSGRNGVMFKLSNGKTLFVGSQKTPQFIEALEHTSLAKAS